MLRTAQTHLDEFDHRILGRQRGEQAVEQRAAGHARLEEVHDDPGLPARGLHLADKLWRADLDHRAKARSGAIVAHLLQALLAERLEDAVIVHGVLLLELVEGHVLDAAHALRQG